ncbi:response regulator transcription factor [Nocardioides speluncae]|uniref:response regulator transcription factor n=1 Tax=Nocardioides speluncae TaxID=2670337 RepID=UPI000D68EEF0|nr:response regulator transcription factor [Nocardioides speluncae]
MTDRVRVLLADDEPLVRHGLRGILDAEADIEVVGEAADGATAVSQTRALRPDLVCMDIQMPGVDGLRATSLVLGLPTPPKVLVLTTFGSDENVFAALAAGAAAFLLKRASGDEIAAAVRAVAAGDSLLFPETVRSLAAAHVRAPTSYAGPELTARETEVLALVAQGLSNAEIAASLVVGVETVRTHVARLLAKLGARDRTQAVVIAYQTGLVPLTP